MAEIRTNNAKAKLKAGGTVIALGGVDSPEMVDMLGPSSVDAFWFEAEHGPVDYGHIGDLTRACDLWGKTSIVRVGWNEENIIYRRQTDVQAHRDCHTCKLSSRTHAHTKVYTYIHHYLTTFDVYTYR